MRRVLVVDGGFESCRFAKLALEVDGSCRVTTALTAFDAIAAMAHERPHGAVIDTAMPSMNGLSIANHALSLGVPVLMMTGEPQLQQSFSARDIPFIAKPLQARDIVAETALLLRDAKERHAQLAVQMTRLMKNLAELDEVVRQSQMLGRRSSELRRRLRRC